MTDVAPETLIFNHDAVTPRMLVDFKEKTGLSLMSLVDGDGFDMKTMDEVSIAAVIWLALRMSGRSDATWDEALDTPFSVLAPATTGTPAETPDPT